MNKTQKQLVMEEFEYYLNGLNSLQKQIDGSFPKGLEPIKQEMADLKERLRSDSKEYSTKRFRTGASGILTSILIPGIQRAAVSFDCRVGSHPSTWGDAIFKTKMDLDHYKEQLKNVAD